MKYKHTCGCCGAQWEDDKPVGILCAGCVIAGTGNPFATAGSGLIPSPFEEAPSEPDGGWEAAARLQAELEHTKQALAAEVERRESAEALLDDAHGAVQRNTLWAKWLIRLGEYRARYGKDGGT